MLGSVSVKQAEDAASAENQNRAQVGRKQGREESQTPSWMETLCSHIWLSIRPSKSNCRPELPQNRSRPWFAGAKLFTAGSQNLAFWGADSSHMPDPGGVLRLHLGVTDRSRKAQLDVTAHREPSSRAIHNVTLMETALLREPLSGSGASVAVSLLCTEVSFHPAVPAIGKVLAVTVVSVLPLRGPAVCLPSHLRTWPRGSPCLGAGGRSAPKAAACRGQRTGRVISTTWKLNSERVLVCGGGYNNNNTTKVQTERLTDSGRSLLVVWRLDARLVGLCLALSHWVLPRQME